MLIRFSKGLELDLPPEDPFRSFLTRFAIAFLCLMAGWNFVKWWLAQ